MCLTVSCALKQIALDSKQRYLGLCDDNGEIHVIDTQKKKKTQILKKGHTNVRVLCSPMMIIGFTTADLLSSLYFHTDDAYISRFYDVYYDCNMIVI